MKKMIFEKNDIKKSVAVTIGVLALIFKLALTCTQYATIYPPLAPLDDDLMFKAAQSIVQGNWLGDYGWLTISKHMFFALWLAFLHTVKIPYMAGNMILWAAASLVCLLAFAPVIRKNWAKLFMFCSLLYNPAACASYASRIYRDSIFPSLCLIFFSCIAAVGIRYTEKSKKWLGWLIGIGASFGCIYLCREDGAWVLPFAAAAIVIIVGLLIYTKDRELLLKLGGFVVSFAVGAAVIAGYCYMNYRYYGRFIISDFTGSEFKSAYGALTSLRQDDWHPMVAVPEDVRQDVYRAVEMFAPVEEALKEPLLVNGYKNRSIDDFTSGSFYWALRKALDSLGVYETPQKALEYYTQLTEEIQKAVDSGKLQTSNGSNKLRKSVTPPIKAEYIPDVLAETGRGFWASVTFRQCDPLAHRAVGREDEIAPVEEFIHQKGAVALIENTETPYLSPVRSITHGFLRFMAAVYKICIPVMLIISFIWQVKKLRADIRAEKTDGESMLNVIMLGFLAMAVLRCAMIAFVEVSSFGIGTYVMYLSTVHPLLIAYSFMGFAKTFEF